MKLSYGFTLFGLLAGVLLPLPADAQVSQPRPVFTRPTLEREQQQDTLRLKRDQEEFRRQQGRLSPPRQRSMEEQLRLQRLQRRHLQQRQQLEQQSLQRRLQIAPRTAPQARQSAQAQGFVREGREQGLQHKIERRSWSYPRSPATGAPGAFGPSPSANPRSRLRLR